MTSEQQPNKVVHIQIESDQDGTRSLQTVKADWFRKGDIDYYRYQEPDAEQMGQTMTTIRIHPEEIRIIRHGDVESSQTFVAGMHRQGFYHTPHIRLQLTTNTARIEHHGNEDGSTRWRLTYQLMVNEQPAGHYELMFRIWGI